MGAPHVKTEKILEHVEESKGNMTTLASLVGCSRDTLYRRMEKDPEVKAAIESVRESTTDKIESALINKALNGDITAQIFYLKTMGRSRGWNERQQLEISGRLESEREKDPRKDAEYLLEVMGAVRELEALKLGDGAKIDGPDEADAAAKKGPTKILEGALV